jgi:hypothetical protein
MIGALTDAERAALMNGGPALVWNLPAVVSAVTFRLVMTAHKPSPIEAHNRALLEALRKRRGE